MKFADSKPEILSPPGRWCASAYAALSPRWQARFLRFAAIFFFAVAAVAEYRDFTAPPKPAGQSGIESVAPHTAPWQRNGKFVALIVGVWLLIGSRIIDGVIRRSESRDPLSPNFKGNGALDECERLLDAELDRHHRPLR